MNERIVRRMTSDGTTGNANASQKPIVHLRRDARRRESQ